MSPRVKTDDSDEDRKRRPDATQNAIRAKVARAVRIVFGVLAAILALGASSWCCATTSTQDNVVVKAIIDIADAISGPFSLQDGIFDFKGKNAVSKNALLNWGIAADRLPADRAFPGQRDRAQERPLSSSPTPAGHARAL